MTQYQTFPDAPGDSESLAKLKALRLPVLVGQRFLDLGCNEGFFCGYARFAGAREVVGLDASPVFIERARKRFAGIEFLNQSWDELPAGEFDVILLASSLHYARDQPALIDRAVAALAPGGTLVLELGVAKGDGAEWVQVKRGADTRLFPTWAQLTETLERHAWKLISESVPQKGDPVARYTLHINRRLPVAYLLLEPPGFGKTTLCKSVFKPAGVPVVSADNVMVEIAAGKLACDGELQQLIAAKCSPDSLDKTLLALIKAGLLAQWLDALLSKAQGKTFALDAWIPQAHRQQALKHIKDSGYLAVTLNWDRPGAELQASGKVVDMADAFYAELQPGRPDADPGNTFVLKPRLPFKGTLGSVTQLGVSSERLELFGWAVHEDGRMPAVLVVRIGAHEHVVNAYDRRAFPELQTRLGLPHPMFGFRFSMPVPADVPLTAIPAQLEVFGGASVASLHGPFASGGVRQDAAARLQPTQAPV